MNNSEAMEQIENEEVQNISLYETFDQSTQNNITIDVSIPQPYSLVRDDEINANIQSLNVQQRQVFDFVYSWAKETVKQKSSVKPNLVKPFNLFLSGSGGVGKSHLIKTIYQSVSKELQYHGGSPDKQRVLILVPTGVASINVNGITIHSPLSIPCRRKFYPLDCNSITSLRNKFSEVQSIIIDEISMVSKKLFYQIQQCLVEIFDVPNILFAGKSLLVVGDLYQLSPVNAMAVYASSNSGEPESYVADELWKMFRLVELTEVMRQKGDTSFIDLLNQIRVGHIDENSEMIIQPRFIHSENSNYPKHALHIFLC